MQSAGRLNPGGTDERDPHLRVPIRRTSLPTQPLRAASPNAIATTLKRTFFALQVVQRIVARTAITSIRPHQARVVVVAEFNTDTSCIAKTAIRFQYLPDKQISVSSLQCGRVHELIVSASSRARRIINGLCVDSKHRSSGVNPSLTRYEVFLAFRHSRQRPSCDTTIQNVVTRGLNVLRTL